MCALHGGDAGAFGIPLIPANEGADFAGGGVKGAEAEVAGGEVELLVVERVVGDVHFAVEARDAAVGLEDGGGVVVEAWRTALEERGDDDDLFLAGDSAEALGGGAGDGLGEVEEGNVFTLAEVLSAEELGQADDVGALAGGLADAVRRLVEISVGVGAAAHLDEGYAGSFFSHRSDSKCVNR